MSGALTTGGAPGIGGGASVRVGIQVYMTAQQALAGLQSLSNAAQRLRTDFQTLDIQLRSVDRILTYMAAGGIAVATGQFIKMAAELERMAILIGTLEGSFATANQRMDQLIGLASRAPFSLNAITDAFIKLKTAGIEPITGADGGGPLKALIDGLSAFGATDQQFNRVALAIQQMAGKGVVSLEELRQQMGDAIPTAMRLMAEGLGMTTARLISEIGKGNIEAQRGINALLTTMREKYSGMADLLTNTMGGAYRQLATQFNRLAEETRRAGFFDVITAGLRAVTEAFERLNNAIRDGGSDALSRFFEFVNSNAAGLAGAASAINAFGVAVGGLISGVVGALSELPGEVIAGGVIGFIFFGRTGAIVGAIAGTISEVVAVLGQFIGTIIAMVGQLGGALGLEVNQFLAMGVLGALLFGRIGVFAVIALGIADQIVAGIRTRIANLIAWGYGAAAQVREFFTSFSVSGAYAAGVEARDQFLRDNASQPGQAFGNINVTPLQELFGQSRSNTQVSEQNVRDTVNRFQAAVQAIRDARQQFEGRVGSINDVAGLSQQEASQVEEVTKAYQRMEDRLRSLQGREIDGFLSQQQRRLDQLRDVSARVEERARQAEAAGRTGEAAQLRQEVSSLNQQAAAFQNIMEKIKAADNARIGSRAGVVVQRYANQLNQIREQLEAAMAEFTGGRQSENAEVERVEARFATTARQLANLELQTRALRGSEQERTGTLAEITRLQTLLNDVTQRGIEIARRKAAREREDNTRDADRRIEDLNTGLSRENLNRSTNPFNDRALDILNRSEQYRNVIRQIDDTVRELRRNLEDDPSQTWIGNRIEQLETLRGAYQTFYQQVGSFQEQEAKRAKELWSDVADSVSDALGRGLEVLITQTGSLKDVMNDLFRSISRSVSKYLTDLLFSQVSGALGGAGGGGGGIFGTLFNLVGSIAGGGSLKSAMGNVFSSGMVRRFGNGAGFTNGVVSGPTLFNIGEMGEAGPEAIMPLTRIGGRLGVQASGGGSINNINITALDAASVRELFFREGGAIVDALNMRNRLNRGMR